ncbi:hypothetical protein [Streptomyces sp. NPDC093109]|uniref:hypothetical protein n=1 Tax=Streptomyces sp. NPDC093109 TaxID=3154977 RepID=UPI00344CC5EE
MSSTLKNRLAAVAPVAVGGAVAVLIGVRLHDHHVPWLLLLACTLAVFGSLADTTGRVTAAWTASTHRCTVPGCGFTVRLAHTSPGENRRWQELAAAHDRNHRPA